MSGVSKKQVEEVLKNEKLLKKYEEPE